MDYEKKYNEALEDMRVIYPNLKGEAKLAVEHAFPELAESNDERIRKELVSIVKAYRENCIDEGNHRFDDCLAYLEKQKDSVSNAKYIDDIAHAFEDGRKKGIEEKQKSAPISCSHENGTPAEVCYGPKGDPDPAGVWKPSEEQMNALLAVFNDPNNIWSESCQLALSGLYEQLKKLM